MRAKPTITGIFNREGILLGVTSGGSSLGRNEVVRSTHESMLDGAVPHSFLLEFLYCCLSVLRALHIQEQLGTQHNRTWFHLCQQKSQDGGGKTSNGLVLWS